MIRQATAGKSALLLIRTPFQAWLARRVLASEGIDIYDLVYFTHNDSPEDRHYYAELANGAGNAQYCHVPARRFDIAGHLEFHRLTRTWRRRASRDMLMLASINAPVINALATIHGGSELVTFDDGLANILPDGMYARDTDSIRSRLYKRLLGATGLDEIKTRIQRHYTIYPDFDNIVESFRLRVLDGWQRGLRTPSTEDIGRTYFIGQPFEEFLDAEQIHSLAAHLRLMNIDYYVPHPREKRPLDLQIPRLDKQGRLAEEAILEHGQGQPIHVVGCFTSVLFNLSNAVDKRTLLLHKHTDTGSVRQSMGIRAGCDVVLI